MRVKRLTKKQVRQEYKHLRSRLGKSPTSKEFSAYAHGMVHLDRMFGKPGWSNFLASMGITPRRRHVTREQLVQAYHRLRRKLGRTPLCHEYITSCYSYYHVQKVCGDHPWRGLRRAAGDPILQVGDVSPERLLEAYKGFKKKLKQQPTLQEYIKNCYAAVHVQHAFGNRGWEKLQKKAGDLPFAEQLISRDTLIQKYRKLKAALGRRPLLNEYVRHCHTTKVLERVFQRPGWRNMLRSIGEERYPPGRQLTTTHLIEHYHRIKADLGYPPTNKEFRRRSGHGMKPIMRIYGKKAWSKFVAAAESTQQHS